MGACYANIADPGEQLYADILNELSSEKLTIPIVCTLYSNNVSKSRVDSEKIFSLIEKDFYRRDPKFNCFVDVHKKIFDLIVAKTETTKDFHRFVIYFILFLDNKRTDAESYLFKGLNSDFAGFKAAFLDFVFFNVYTLNQTIFKEFKKKATPTEIEQMEKFNKIVTKEAVIKASEQIFDSLKLNEVMYDKQAEVAFRTEGVFSQISLLRNHVSEICTEIFLNKES